MLKKVLSVVLAASVMLASLCTVTVGASALGITSSVYSVDETELTISNVVRFTKQADFLGNINIPDGALVTVLGTVREGYLTGDDENALLVSDGTESKIYKISFYGKQRSLNDPSYAGSWNDLRSYMATVKDPNNTNSDDSRILYKRTVVSGTAPTENDTENSIAYKAGGTGYYYEDLIGLNDIEGSNYDKYRIGGSSQGLIPPLFNGNVYGAGLSVAGETVQYSLLKESSRNTLAISGKTISAGNKTLHDFGYTLKGNLSADENSYGEDIVYSLAINIRNGAGRYTIEPYFYGQNVSTGKAYNEGSYKYFAQNKQTSSATITVYGSSGDVYIGAGGLNTASNYVTGYGDKVATLGKQAEKKLDVVAKKPVAGDKYYIIKAVYVDGVKVDWTSITNGASSNGSVWLDSTTGEEISAATADCWYAIPYSEATYKITGGIYRVYFASSGVTGSASGASMSYRAIVNDLDFYTSNGFTPDSSDVSLTARDGASASVDGTVINAASEQTASELLGEFDYTASAAIKNADGTSVNDGDKVEEGMILQLTQGSAVSSYYISLPSDDNNWYVNGTSLNGAVTANVLSDIADGKPYSFIKTVYNHGGSLETANIYSVFFGENGSVLGMASGSNAVMTGNDSRNVKIYFNSDETEGNVGLPSGTREIKIFIFENLHGLKPLSEILTIN